MRIVIIGAPGSGTDVQARLIAEKFNIAAISISDAIKKTAVNKKLYRSGKDAVTVAVLDARVRERDCKRGFVIYDYPHNIPSAQALDMALNVAGRGLQLIFLLTAADEVLSKRIDGRMECKKCGMKYDRHFNPPKARNKCDRCGGQVLASRKSRISTSARIKEYHSRGESLLDYYKAQHKLRKVQIDENDALTFDKLIELIDLEIRPLAPAATQVKYVEDKVSDTVIAGGEISWAYDAAITKVTHKKVSKDNKKTVRKKATTKKSNKKIVKKKTTKRKVTKKKVIPKKTAKKSRAR